MINLLPNDAKKQIRAGRWNVDLIRYVIVFCFATLFLAAITGGMYLILKDSKTNAETLIQTTQTKTTAYSSVQTQADSFKTNLATAKSILDQQVSYSKIIMGIGQALPAGVILDKIAITNDTIGTPISLQGHAKTNASAMKVVDSFRNSPLFSNVSIGSVEQTGTSNLPEYPWSVTINITISRGAAG